MQCTFRSKNRVKKSKIQIKWNVLEYKKKHSMQIKNSCGVRIHFAFVSWCVLFWYKSFWRATWWAVNQEIWINYEKLILLGVSLCAVLNFDFSTSKILTLILFSKSAFKRSLHTFKLAIKIHKMRISRFVF